MTGPAQSALDDLARRAARQTVADVLADDAARYDAQARRADYEYRRGPHYRVYRNINDKYPCGVAVLRKVKR